MILSCSFFILITTSFAYGADTPSSSYKNTLVDWGAWGAKGIQRLLGSHQSCDPRHSVDQLALDAKYQLAIRDERAIQEVKQVANNLFTRGQDSLNYEFFSLGDHGVKPLGTSPHMVNIKSLNLNSTKISDKGVSYIMGSDSTFYTLERLYLKDNFLTDAAVKTIAFSEKAKNLKSLHMASNLLTSNAITLLSHSPFLSQLESLHINSSQIGFQDLLGIAQVREKKFPSLQSVGYKNSSGSYTTVSIDVFSKALSNKK